MSVYARSVSQTVKRRKYAAPKSGSGRRWYCLNGDTRPPSRRRHITYFFFDLEVSERIAGIFFFLRRRSSKGDGRYLQQEQNDAAPKAKAVVVVVHVDKRGPLRAARASPHLSSANSTVWRGLSQLTAGMAQGYDGAIQ